MRYGRRLGEYHAMSARQFNAVSCKYGAPMGRVEHGTIENCEPRSVELFRVRLSDGYDDGGAYWGSDRPWMGTTGALYCARSTDGTYRRFMRARSRHEAAIELQIPNALLLRPMAGLA